jgi:hypothetical protein
MPFPHACCHNILLSTSEIAAEHRLPVSTMLGTIVSGSIDKLARKFLRVLLLQPLGLAPSLNPVHLKGKIRSQAGLRTGLRFHTIALITSANGPATKAPPTTPQRHASAPESLAACSLPC